MPHGLLVPRRPPTAPLMSTIVTKMIFSRADPDTESTIVLPALALVLPLPLEETQLYQYWTNQMSMTKHSILSFLVAALASLAKTAQLLAQNRRMKCPITRRPQHLRLTADPRKRLTTS